MSTWTQLAGQVLNGYKLSEEEAIQILECPEDDLLKLLDGAFQIRRHYYGKKVKLNMIINTKSGL
ncbi:MAG: biotin synthase BioB, partial [Domibacillus tundrae]